MLSMLLAQRGVEDVADKFDTALNNMAGGLLMIDKDERVQVSTSASPGCSAFAAAPVDLAVER